MFALIRQGAIAESVSMLALSLILGVIVVALFAFLGSGLWLPLAPPVACTAFIWQALSELNKRARVLDAEASGGIVT